jgi:glycosyltransferase involved in cell wall biosynthesis
MKKMDFLGDYERWCGGDTSVRTALSVLIPMYRYDCSQLVADLRKQGDALGVGYEIIVADDEKLRLGRARVRNWLADKAQGEKLLFIDCDAGVDDAHFLERYLKASTQATVVCGGQHNVDVLPSPDVSLRFYYEAAAHHQREAARRNQRPYERFSSFNFLIDSKTFRSIGFDERFTEYGHEDTLFGAELQRRGIGVLHIDNPLLNTDIETNAVFLDKSRTALRSLKRMEAELQDYSTLLRGYRKVRRLGLKRLLACLFRRYGTRWERQLTESAHPSLGLFKLYKLAYYCTL